MKTLVSMIVFLGFIILFSDKIHSETTELEQIENLVSQMFDSERKVECTPSKKQSSLKKNGYSDNQSNNSNSKNSQSKNQKGFIKSGKSNSAWLKSWGYGPSAYLFDFLNPVLKDIFVSEGNSIITDLKSLPSDKLGDYTDPFDYSNFLSSEMTPEEKKKLLDNPALINSNYVKETYTNSINAVQLKAAMIKNKWFIDKTLMDPAKIFVQEYDMDGDGRLNPRELILGIIDSNRSVLGSPISKNLFNETVRKLSAMFAFIDCNNDSFATAEEIWNNFKNLKRPTEAYSLYSIAPELRTVAVNDFILKSHETKNGSLNKTEFIVGILYGLWNRQTTSTGILNDDSRSLTNLRWQNQGQTDKEVMSILAKQGKSKIK